MEDIDLTPFCKTKAEAMDFSARLSTIVSHIFQTSFDLEHELSQELGIQKKDLFLFLLRDKNINPSAQSDLKDFLSKLQEIALNMPVLSISLAFEPKEDTLTFLSEWFLTNLHKQVLFDIVVDSNLIAGAAVSYQGKFLDFSIKPIFTRILEESLSPTPVAK
ncbi:MAG: hypothetical protein ACM3IJ_04835 [Candidatus Levyibacteriota bacterium]